jgi:ATP/maltotriose-dependent transcriptional regulator MalT
MARRSNTETFSGVVSWAYGHAIHFGVLRADDSAVRACEDALQTAHGASNDRALGLAGYALAVGLLNRDDAADRQRGLELMMQTRDLWLRKRALFLIPVTDVFTARETARRGDRDAAIPVMRQAVGELRQAEHLFYGVWGAGVLVETLLERGAQGDLAEAHEAMEWLANLAADQDSAMLDVTLLRLRALLARARGEDVAYRDLVYRYRAMAKSLGYEGHIAWAEALMKG